MGVDFQGAMKVKTVWYVHHNSEDIRHDVNVKIQKVQPLQKAGP